MLALVAIYFSASKFGFGLATAAKQVSAVWPPTGIALAAMLLYGPRVWPAIALGAFLANVTTHEPVATACGIAIGNTLEAAAGAWLLRRLAGFDPALGRLRDVRGLLIFAALMSTTISATVGVTSLCLGGVQPWATYRSLWLLWWVGDATGAIIVAPLLLVWGNQLRPAWNSRALIEGFLLAAGLSLLCLGLFGQKSIAGLYTNDFVYLVFIFVIWTASRFGQHGTTLVTAAVSSIAIGAAFLNSGPFTSMAPDQNLAALQIFVAVLAMTGLFLGAAITERKNVEKAQMHDIARREQAENALKAANRNKDEFLSTLAHELRNPLASVSGALYLLQSPMTGPEQRAKAQTIMERQLQQVIRLIEDLVDVARISHGKIDLRREPVALSEAIALAAETATPFMEHNRHVFLIELPPEPLWLDADPTRLTQIFVNLLNNAAKYTPAGGHITLKAESDGSALTVRVRDNGIGITSDMLPKVFDMFAQAQNTSMPNPGGLGIGLTLVKQLTEMHGGQVQAHSAGPGAGSEFIVRLPLIAAPAARAEPVRAPAQNSRTFRILLVDDNESFAETFSHMLRLLGHQVLLAHDGPAALRVAESCVPEIVLLDIGLPGMNGYDVCQKMRAMPALRYSVLIAQTGYNQPEHRERLRAAGFDYHLVKPVKFDMLETLLQSIAASAGIPAKEASYRKAG